MPWKYQFTAWYLLEKWREGHKENNRKQTRKHYYVTGINPWLACILNCCIAYCHISKYAWVIKDVLYLLCEEWLCLNSCWTSDIRDELWQWSIELYLAWWDWRELVVQNLESTTWRQEKPCWKQTHLRSSCEDQLRSRAVGWSTLYMSNSCMDWRVNGQKKTISGYKVCGRKTAEGRESFNLLFVVLAFSFTFVWNRMPRWMALGHIWYKILF